MRQKLQNLKSEAIAQIMDAQSVDDLNIIKTHYLGRKGKLTKVFTEIRTVPKNERKSLGVLLNSIKESVEKALTNQVNEMTDRPDDWFDATIPGVPHAVGTLHLVTQAIDEITRVFRQIGFTRVRYPEVDWEWYAFTALNFPENHPAMDDMETFSIDRKPDPKLGKMILTPHTSNGQVREMQRVKPPIRMTNISKCYRRESDASHFPMFHQFEGLVIDEGVSIVHLKGTIDHFAQNYFGSDRVTRLRPHNFRFTEPSFEVDITCDICEGKGKIRGKKCKVCKVGWLELGGAGMVHPNVLRAGNIDPAKHTGFAFGIGVERVLMMKSGIKIPDLRLLYSSDLRFLKQF
ncbi:phenylalanine--tRNA ligase subunit alpha [Patescibacteria group bacterium]